ncbi:MAG: restriction endonuclease subunit S [gamma proteobacterium symbiont of Bathyaustriella thionipta]|nr:restriction endonuclease subunit S [gamma proteobacterium symbiont of Bathyaustriella thionipta]MCU7950376.1 restriction endonuclease subunit S [gamma proteobacterium symbiont of Bathyaustriella thionipta]MCU7952365.1 restriction endonuclease subunit S [gamma proteobacterium symbiont of Bathyaustriella thionipta]MCU7956886.1 restriction endonuclease subunit S [gamma proteobacterium symbiont of Bathyaustriella thionipta]MCU7966485.1 restriction endonuclease subunit S [gamma proteobacterium sy
MKKTFCAVTQIGNGQVDPKMAPYFSMLHIGPENVVSDSGQLVNVKTCSELGLISGKYEFDENSIVYSKIRPNLNKLCKPGFKGVCSADMYPIWSKDDLSIDYLFHYMLGPSFYKIAVSMSMRTGMPKINRSDLNNVPILVPPLEIQKKIAQILSTWDKAISTTESLIENSQQQKKSLMQQLLTGKKRSPVFEAEWKAYRLGDLFTERVETNCENLPLLSITAERGVIHQNESGKKDTSNNDKAKYRRICVNDIGYNTMRMWQGRSSLSDKEGIVSPAYTIVIPCETIYPAFAAYMFKLPELVHIFSRHSQGLVSDTWNLKYNHFKKIKWKFPCIEEQKKIASVLINADKEIKLLKKQLADLKQEKKALMQQLLTGKRQVKIDTLSEATC